MSAACIQMPGSSVLPTAMHKRGLQLLFGFILVSLTAGMAIMLLGNIAMSAYVLRQLARLGPADSMGTLLSARNS